MAVIKAFHRDASGSRRHPTAVDCHWQIINEPDGALLQLSTYGSDSRQSEPKVSQTLQLDRTSAAELLRIVNVAFPDLRPDQGQHAA